MSYLSNFYFAKLGWFPNHINHLWSLAVEEQFYLVWPFVIVLTPRRFLLPTLVAIAAVGPAYRWIGGLMDVDWMWTFTPPFANVDSLALGGILAYAWATEDQGALRLRSGQAGGAEGKGRTARCERVRCGRRWRGSVDGSGRRS